MHEHMKAAAEAFANKYNNMSTEESICVLIDKIVAKSPYDENNSISCQDAQVFVKTIANNLENLDRGTTSQIQSANKQSPSPSCKLWRPQRQ